MQAVRFMVIYLLILSALLVGCAAENYPENAVAVVNGVIITQEEVDQELTERQMAIAMYEKMAALEPNQLTPKETVLLMLGIAENELTPEQIRYIESRERATTKLLSRNEAFNVLLREEVYYQQAVKQGHEASVEEAKQLIVDTDEITRQMLALSDDEAWLNRQDELIKSINEIYKEYGYESEKDYLNERLDKTAKAMTINRMKNRFDEVIADKFPEAVGLPQSIAISNAWDDYGEFLLGRAKIKILNSDYSVELYGEPWEYGVLDLKSK